MTRDDILKTIALYFPQNPSTANPDAQAKLVERLLAMPTAPLTRTHLNQFLHLANEAGVGALRQRPRRRELLLHPDALVTLTDAAEPVTHLLGLRR